MKLNHPFKDYMQNTFHEPIEGISQEDFGKIRACINKGHKYYMRLILEFFILYTNDDIEPIGKAVKYEPEAARACPVNSNQNFWQKSFFFYKSSENSI